MVERNVLAGMSSGEVWFESLTREEQRLVSAAFSCTLTLTGPTWSAHTAFPNGSTAYFCIARCDDCVADHVLAIEFYERQPARYIAVLQGVARLTPGGPSGLAPPGHAA